MFVKSNYIVTISFQIISMLCLHSTLPRLATENYNQVYIIISRIYNYYFKPLTDVSKRKRTVWRVRQKPNRVTNISLQ